VTFGDVYGTLLTWLLSSPVERSERTGRAVHVGRGGTSFRLDLSDGLLPTCGLRKTYPRTAAAETVWYLMAKQDLAWLRKYAPIWDKFAERIADGDQQDRIDDGFDGIRAAYGYRWRKHFGRDQLGLAIEALRVDPSDRRCLVSAWDPSADGLGAVGQRNVPCPASFTLGVTGGEVHSTLLLRSSDVFVGLPYDVMGHALLVDAVAASLDLTPGVLTFVLANAHLYEDHWKMAEECIRRAGEGFMPAMPLPRWTVKQAAANPDTYVEVVTGFAAECTWPTYAPRPEVVL